MTSDIIKSQSFEEKMKARLKESVGDLITDDELQKILYRGMDEIFFKSMDIVNEWGRVTGQKTPLAHTLVKELLKERVDVLLTQWIKDHPDQINDIIKEVVTAGIGNALISALTTKFQSDLYMFQNNLINKINGGHS